MRRSNVFIISIILAAAVVIGAAAALRTVRLGHGGTTRPAAAATLSARRAALDRMQASVRHALAQRPPKLPSVPQYAKPAVPSPSASAPAIRYVRPAPIVVVKHHAGAEHEQGEHERDGGGDD